MSVSMATSPALFRLRPLVVGALHLPELTSAAGRSMASLEDYTLRNAEIFARAGVPALMLQDETRESGPTAPATVAVMAALGRLFTSTFPQTQLGIIVQAHDAVGPLAIAHACGATFVRLKVYVGAVMNAEGPRHGLGVTARATRTTLGRGDIAILADVHDRTSVPLGAVPNEEAALWAQGLGADGLVLTGATFAQSLERIRSAREVGVRRPILVGGGVSAENVGAALEVADGVIVSSSLMREDAGSDVLRWSLDRAMLFMERAQGSSGTATAGLD